ncbi:aminotransferase class V-fold PLP-dependent enzyme [Sporosalibacterium faouarense]|uniref:aminotransferase class V-fold PLP-dependent enzyme n=1 Tax=Sporosalibacterium faouarense TaxID=516123 RepID=UPI00141C6A3F|nr:aminotransferase class V-fold PLP-dependent enzyme [Sporosalibacterium faouarense]MTI48633.1 aminotransferase class V-fold PLP-dependent enzyme [Bacillota bacterium]
MIYLDNAATSFPKPEKVYEAIMSVMKDYGANPGRSGHKLALKAGRGIYETRELLSKLFNISNPMNIIFTSNATDGLNLAIKGILKPGDHVITTSMEHNSVLRPLKALEKLGIETSIVQCDSKGCISVQDIEDNINEDTKLIITTHASNVTGTIFPIKEIGNIADKNNIIYMVDAAQTAGVYDIDVENMKIDILAFPGHKSLLGPQGTGGVYIREGIDVMQMKEGGTGSKSDLLIQPEMLPDKFESGTPNTPGIIGLGAGVQYILDKGIENIRKHEKNMTKYFLDELKKIELVRIYGPCDAEKQAPVVSINIGDEDSSEVSYILDKVFDIGVRPGLHCAPLAHKTIGTFEQGTVRFSLGTFTTHQDIEKALEAIKNIVNEI